MGATDHCLFERHFHLPSVLDSSLSVDQSRPDPHEHPQARHYRNTSLHRHFRSRKRSEVSPRGFRHSSSNILRYFVAYSSCYWSFVGDLSDNGLAEKRSPSISRYSDISSSYAVYSTWFNVRSVHAEDLHIFEDRRFGISQPGCK